MGCCNSPDDQEYSRAGCQEFIHTAPPSVDLLIQSGSCLLGSLHLNVGVGSCGDLLMAASQLYPQVGYLGTASREKILAPIGGFKKWQ